MNGIPQTDQDARRTLQRHKRSATGLLAVMAGLTVAGYALPQMGWLAERPWLEILRSGTKAGVVGGLADWFAVTALFRRPMGLPIPHTAILPAQKERLAQALGRFVSTNVFTEQEVAAAFSRIDLPSIIGNILQEPETLDMVNRAVLGSVPHVLDRLEDGRASSAIARLLPTLLGGEEIAPVVTRSLRAMVEGDCHQEVLSFLLSRLKEGIKAKEPALRMMIEERVREQGGRVLGWAIGGSIATKVLLAAGQELDRIDPQNSELREGFTTWVRTEIDRIEQDPVRRREITDAVMGVLTHDSVRGWSSDVWRRLRRLIEEDMSKGDTGWLSSLVRDALQRLADQMYHDASMRKRVEDGARGMIMGSLPFLRDRMSRFIYSVVNGWDAESLSDRLELRVGKDLQYIRLNGTLVGFLAGCGLSVLLQLIFGTGIG
ncbi:MULTISPECIES: DUF445 domain-containing protein [Komagataeibacter]|uniref:DUF445 domain-containing protein n=2 Tax=Komagataeibacter TaxID=1434011 RepID=A0A318QZT4_9PROT|nr:MULTISPECIES: DUF445 domain-containing protein [Komagataeibacter]MBL7233791.1 DUF445 domain-containing protein [Komagataeibacter oboediens]MBT0674858.1 DUF445 domain-containing protein [Komagataeibacter oboediens]MBT0678594.1 DUF445 domain-containing protein [Komagataeibacter oboediens]MBV0887653.1 DUF445 domain-containing protein [Komagataeibacter oboediens]MBV1822548.1 DUF445 domain-containing protein [Komagataeibacter oboediens]